jgi:uncharacterized protein YjiS (DUF1127 family)
MSHARHHSSGRRSKPWPERAAEALTLWSARAAQRRKLRELPDDRLRDLGLTRKQALAEAAKPFWRR